MHEHEHDEDLEMRRATVEKRWGKASEIRVFDNPGISINVLKWNKSANPSGVNLYVTIGTPTPAPSAEHVDEFLLGLDPDAFTAGWVVAALASMRAEKRGRVGHNSTAGFGKPLWDGTRMSGVLVLSYTDEDRHIAMPDGRHLDLLTVFPVFDEEIKYIQQQGTDAFMDMWEERGVSFWDPFRENTCD
jgi:hypothetical protein